jgi:hypothetical protein
MNDTSVVVQGKDLPAIYTEFGCKNIEEFDDKFRSEDQQLMKTYSWDYANDNLVANKMFRAIEHISLSSFDNADERYWVQHILWAWYNHATGCALWRYGDRVKATEYSEKALDIQPKPHPNKITKLMYHLVRDELAEAESWAQTITTEPESSTAQDTIELYKRGEFFKPQDFTSR